MIGYGTSCFLCYSPLYPSSVYDYDFYHLFYVYDVIVAFRRDVQCEKNSDDEHLNLFARSLMSLLRSQCYNTCRSFTDLI